MHFVSSPVPAPSGQRPPARAARRQIFWLTWQYLVSVVLTIAIGRSYLAFLPEKTPLSGWLAASMALMSTAILLNLVPALLLAGPVLIVRRPWFTVLSGAVLFSALDVFVYADTVIYGIFRFHVNGLVLNLLTTPGAGDSYTFGSGTILSSVRTVLLILGAHLAFAAALVRSTWLQARLPSGRALVRVALPALAAIFLADKATFMLGDLYNHPHLTRARHLFPLYRPIVMREFAIKHLGVKIAKEENLTLDYGSTVLRYPKAPLSFPPGARKPNVLVIAIEGGRYDMLDPQVMPFLDRWSRSNLRFDLHYSGGNASRFGIFTMLYGIYGTYWHKVLAERQSSAMIGTLRRLGYDFRVLSGDNLNFPEFRKTAFIEIPGAITDTWTCRRVDRDREMADLFESFVGSTKPPFFTFMFFDASHQPYLFPDEDRVFTPFLDKAALDYTKLAKGSAEMATLLRNRYKNSLHYIDRQLARVIDSLERRGLLDSTLVFITGDHGEEFYELGYLGHNSTFSRYQTRTFMVAHVPGQAPRTIERITSHLDIVPTVFTYMGATNPVSDYSEGTPLTDAEGPSSVVVSSWDTAALVSKDSTVVFGTESTNGGLEAYSDDYKPDPAAVAPRREALFALMHRMSEFSR